LGQLTDAVLSWVPLVDADGGPEPVHQMRVALRRLRSVLKIFRAAATAPALDETAQGLRELAQTLGHARDWDVFLRGLGRQMADAFAGEKPVSRLLAAAERRRRESYQQLSTALGDPAFRQLVLLLAELAATRPWDRTPAQNASPQEDLEGFARHALAHRLRRAVRAGSGFAERSPRELHALRLHCKRLRYAAEMFAPLFPGGGAKRFLHRLAQVQDRLGHLNDAAVAEALMQQLAGFSGRALAVGLVRGFIAAGGADARDRAERHWRRFRRCEPFWG